MADEMTPFDPGAEGAVADAPEPAAAPDPNLGDAAATLAGQLEKPGSAPGPKTAAPAPSAAPPPASPSPRQEGYKRFQDGYKGRIQRTHAELQERRRLQTEYDERIKAQNVLLEQTREALKGLRQPVAEEEIPDPVLDPAGFQKWALGQTEAKVQEALKPIVEAEQRRQEQVEQILREREQEQHVERVTHELIGQYQAWEEEYVREAPELAHGFQDRFHTMRDSILTPAFEAAGYAREKAANMVNLWFHAISQDAAESGQNPAAVLDAFFTGIAAQFGLEPVSAEGGNGNGAPASGGRPVARTETERLAAVQRRAAPAATAAPRVASRVHQPASQLEELYRGGVRDHLELRRAAMLDAHGDPKAAAFALQRLAQQV